MQHSGKHDPVPTFLKPVAGIKFRMNFSKKTKQKQNPVTYVFVLFRLNIGLHDL